MANENQVAQQPQQQQINPALVSGEATKSIVKGIASLNDMIDLLSTNYKAALDEIAKLKEEVRQLRTNMIQGISENKPT